MGIKGFAPDFPEPPEAFCGGPSAEPPVGLELLRVWVDGLFAVKDVWPQVLTPDDATLASSIDVTSPPADEVCGDRARMRGAVDVAGGTLGSTDLLSEGPS
jgi:hypothetical protein